jgi:hypothetical protein
VQVPLQSAEQQGAVDCWEVASYAQLNHGLKVPEVGEGAVVAFSMEQYAKLRPTLWHVTHRANLDRIRTSRILLPAEQLTAVPLKEVRRGRKIDSGTPVLRDQDLLHEKCIEFSEGFSFADLLSELNRRVFFWPGSRDRPIRPGQRSIDRYSNSDVIIRLSFLEVEKERSARITARKVRGMRMQHGKRVPRGPNTFLQAPECDFPPSKVVEVTFLQSVKLPRDCEVACCLGGRWEIL